MQWLGQQQCEIASVIAVARLFRPFQKDGCGGMFRRNGFQRALEKLSQMGFQIQGLIDRE